MAARNEPGVMRRRLLEQIGDECGDDAWFTMEDPRGFLEGQVGHVHLIPQQQTWARDLCRALNKHADMDGAWVVAWCDPVMVDPPLGLVPGTFGMRLPIPSRAVWFHKDRDGDVNFCVDTEDKLTDILRGSIDERVEHAVVAWQEWKSILADVGIDGRNMRKAALGQAPADPKIRVVPFVG